jgi:hypothetical protein
MIRKILVFCLVLFAGCVYKNQEIPAPKGWGALPDPGLWCLPLAGPPSAFDPGNIDRGSFDWVVSTLGQVRILSPTDRDFLDWLVRTYAEKYGLRPYDVRLFVAHESAPTRHGHDGVVVGVLVCNPESEWQRRGRYQITLYRDALVGGTVACLYSTVAHEFRHVLQELESGGATRCGRVADPEVLARLEQDAVTFASEVAPDCDCSGTP